MVNVEWAVSLNLLRDHPIDFLLKDMHQLELIQ